MQKDRMQKKYVKNVKWKETFCRGFFVVIFIGPMTLAFPSVTLLFSTWLEKKCNVEGKPRYYTNKFMTLRENRKAMN